MPNAHGRHSLLALWFLVLWSTEGSQVNVTVDDSDPSIVYAPPNSWNSSNVVCSGCNNPPVMLALQQTYHKGVHVAVLDADDTSSSTAPVQQSSASPAQPSTPTAQPSAPAGSTNAAPANNHATSSPNATPSLSLSSASRPVSSSAGTSAVSAPSPPPDKGDPDDKGGGGSDDDGDDDEKHKSGKSQPSRRNTRVPRMDSDDPGFVDAPVSAQYNFTGTAVYVFGIQPQAMSTLQASPSLMNVTFSVDGVTENPFVHQGSSSGSGFAYNANVFAKQGLSDGPHTLKMNLAPNSIFILDYILVTKTVADTPSAFAMSSTPIPSQSTTSSSTRGTNKGRASFAGAVSGSLGVLGILCFGTAFSLYRRRRIAARRERLERGNAPSPPAMSGPASFVPRYFPGTVIPTNPPPYAPSTASSAASHVTQLAEPLLPTHPEQTYADTDDLAPPSFGAAITAPAVTLLSGSGVMPPPRPASWGADPHTITLPPSIAPSSRTTSIYTADDDYV
ncbi:Valine-trna ligase [Mycena sanguinolenta]|uniref:Valine-trna ligase n=1 Tax=Mycena sanguinolenta TaxID=230812 RepID=A0A8H7DJ24_9AGAR|nr:Valine-trna ligase [Mycena sanguinolenta]